MRVGAVLLGAAALMLVGVDNASAAPTGGGGGQQSPPSQTGPITVDYETDGGRATTTTITLGSSFRNQGGGDRSPCSFNYLPDGDGDGQVDDVDTIPIESDRWMFRETTPASGEAAADRNLTAAEWAALAALGGLNLSDTLKQYGPVDEAFRRFDVFCNGTHATGLTVNQFQRSILVSIDDPFWGYATRRDELVALLPWPTVTASSQPDSATFGGLPVNMPAVFQMNATSWGGFLSPQVSHRGWTTQIVANSTSMRFVLVFDPDGANAETITVPCVGDAGADLPDSGWIPTRDPSVPDFAEPGQFSAPCVWIPPEPGQLTVTAEVTYEVDSIVTGPTGRRFREDLAGEVRGSAALSLRVDDLRIVNVNPPPLDEAFAGSDR